LAGHYSKHIETPGNATFISPPQLHITIESLSNIGLLFNNTVGFIGNHGAAITGIHGIGVNTPRAAAVAAATVGLAKLIHMPNGIIFKKGTLSQIVPAGILQKNELIGNTTKGDGATPNMH
jgi:hypothetical protein